MSVTLTKEQASILLPLLPNLAGLMTSQQGAANGDECTQPEASYSVSDMFAKKKKNSCSTAAQNYLLAIVRTSAKAANIWEDPPLLRNLTAVQLGKFFDVAFLMCPKLKPYRQQLTTRLSRTLINRRLYVHRQRKKGLSFPIANGQSLPHTSDLERSYNHTAVASHNHTAELEGSHNHTAVASHSCTAELEGSHNHTAVASHSRTAELEGSHNHTAVASHSRTADLELEGSHNHTAEKSLSVSTSTSEVTCTGYDHTSDYRPVSGNTVIVVKRDSTPIGKGIFLKMNSEEPFEQFAKVLCLSTKKRGELDVELPLKSEHGKFNFKELEKGDIFVWKVSRLLPDNCKSSQHSKNTSFNAESSDSDDEEYGNDNGISPYELKRLENIARNKRKLEEIFGTNVNVNRKETNKPIAKKAKRQKHSEPTSEDIEPITINIGEYRAVKCTKYGERPLIGCITRICDKNVEIDWMIGSYSGIWKPWKGRSQGKYVRFTDTIPLEDVLIKVKFTKGMRIPPTTVADLKALYV